MSKINFEIVDLEVQKMFRAAEQDVLIDTFLAQKPHVSIVVDNKVDFIRTYIESCGWSVDEFVKRSFGEESNN